MATDGRCGGDPRPPEPTAEEAGPSPTLCLGLHGLGCSDCATRVQEALLGLEGVLDAHVSLCSSLAAVAYAPGRATDIEILAAVAEAGAGAGRQYFAWVVL